MVYLWYGLILIKLKYLNPVLEDICEIFDEKKSYITKSLFYLFYQNIDLLAVLFYGVSSGSTECAFYTMMSAEFSTYFLLFG